MSAPWSDVDRDRLRLDKAGEVAKAENINPTATSETQAKLCE